MNRACFDMKTKKVLEAVVDKGELTAREVERHTKLSHGVASRLVTRLYRKGLLDREKRDKKYVYWATKDGERLAKFGYDELAYMSSNYAVRDDD